MSGAKSKTSLVVIARSAALLIVNADDEVRHLLEKAIPEPWRSKMSFAFSDDFTLLNADPPPDVVLINVKTEAHPCFKRLSKIQQRWPSSQVIFLSPVDDIHLWAEAIRLGAYDFLPKPVDPDQLMWILQGALGKKRIATQHLGPRKLSLRSSARPLQGFQG
jgi:DNA-binding NtrC family response regulator